MSLKYFAQSIYLCAECGATLVFVNGSKGPEGNLVVVMKCPNHQCQQFGQEMRITHVPMHAPAVSRIV